MIRDRTEKLRFIVEEMQIALHLATNLADPFYARTIARHILIRVENFIEHARGLRRPLRDAGYDTVAFHTAKEAYAAQFGEYFKDARHRLGAHVQDFDFGKRIELWNDIEVLKISYFVDGAHEIYDSLGTLGVPGYVPYATPVELSDPGIVEILRQLQRSLDARTGVEMGADALAMTRRNTTASLNTTPVHARASQLALIRRWIALQLDLRQRLIAYPSIARLFKARLITDIVSFSDCLVTRPVTQGALQAMDGLDKLVQGQGQSSAPIDAFVAAAHFETELAAVRAVRDKIGAHLEIDTAEPLAKLLADLNKFDLERALAFYQRLAAAFNKQCFAVLFLRLYAADGKRHYGMESGASSATVPFVGTAAPPHEPTLQPPLINDDEACHKNLTRWLDGDDSQKGEARIFFWNAFMSSTVVESVSETERFGSSARYHSNEFRKAHQFLLDALNDGLSDIDFRGVLDLIMSCRNGHPYPLAKLLVRYGETAPIFRQYLICYALGEVASAPHQSVSDFLDARSLSRTWAIRLEAVTARYKSYVKNEGVFRANHQGQIQADHDTLVASLTDAMTPDQRLVCLLAFASVHTGPLAGVFTKPFGGNYTVVQAEIERLLLPLLNDDAAQSKAVMLKRLLQTHDYVGVCVHIALSLDGGDSHPLYSSLIESCCNGTIIAASNNQASRHLSMCFLLKKEHRFALQVAEPLADRNPDWTEAQILVAQILGEIIGAETEARERVSSIRSAYKLSAAQEALLAAVEAEVQSRLARQEQ
ncbi:hypothetical protein FVE89_13850 [Methylobacterium sp. 2A]|uniref:hypothetical protein n=1 Tax=Methylobacterium sp. 2A TaxID=2603816 RepID=UPI0013557F62|nr:hypothetical protein [Methylobacterium sp. 2A]MWV23059.1 hypothetical protein [Methylobacterium sp. 2A]